MNPYPDQSDPELDEPGLSALYRQGATQTPPAELDRRILDQAQAALGPRPGNAITRARGTGIAALALVPMLELATALASEGGRAWELAPTGHPFVVGGRPLADCGFGIAATRGAERDAGINRHGALAPG